MRVKALRVGVASDVGFRMPSVWLAEGHSTVAPVYLYRFDWSTPMLRLLRVGAMHATELPYVSENLVQGRKDMTFRLGGRKPGEAVSARIRARWCNFVVEAKPTGLPGEPDWSCYDTDRPCLIIDKQDALGQRHRRAYPRGLGQRPGAELPLTGQPSRSNPRLDFAHNRIRLIADRLPAGSDVGDHVVVHPERTLTRPHAAIAAGQRHRDFGVCLGEAAECQGGLRVAGVGHVHPMVAAF